MMVRKAAAWLSLLSGALLIGWAIYSWVLSPLFGDSRGEYAGPPPGPSLMDDVFTSGNLILLGSALFFGALLVWSFFGLRRPEAAVRQAWSVVALGVGVPVVFWIFFAGGLLGILAGIVGLIEAWRSPGPVSPPAP